MEKSSIDVNRHGVQPKWMKNKSASAGVLPSQVPAETATAAPVVSTGPKACSLDDPTCEACQ